MRIFLILLLLIFTSSCNYSQTQNEPFKQKSTYNSKYKYTDIQTSLITYDFVYDECKDIYMSPTRFIFGNVFENTTYSFYVDLVNKTNQAFDVNIKGTCSCTFVHKGKDSVNANTSLKVGTNYRTTGFPKTKHIRKSIYTENDIIKPKGFARAFHESIIGFKNASIIPKAKEIVFAKGKNTTAFDIENVTTKEIKNLKVRTYQNEIELTPIDLKQGKISSVVLKKGSGNIASGYKTTATFYAQGDSLCVFSVPVIFQ